MKPHHYDTVFAAVLIAALVLAVLYVAAMYR